MRICIIFTLFILGGQPLMAGKLWQKFIIHPDSLVERYDTNYVEVLPNSLTLRYFLNLKQAELTIKPSTDYQNYRYRAGDFLRYGFGFGYRWLILNYSYAIDPQKLGPLGEKSIRHWDVQMNIFGRKWLYDVRAQWYRGFRYQDTFRSDLNLRALGGSLRYNFNHKKYSFKNTYDQTQWQIKSAGTPIAGINYAYTRIDADSTFSFGSNTSFVYPFHENFNIAAGAGYSYTFVYKKHWFITYTLTMYLDGYLVGSEKNFIQNRDFSVTVLPENRFGLGYNSKKIYFGIQGTLHDLPGRLSNDIDYSFRYNNLKLLFIHRLHLNPYAKKDE